MKNPHAQALAALSRGVPKKFSAVEIQKRTARIRAAQAARATAQRAAREAGNATGGDK